MVLRFGVFATAWFGALALGATAHAADPRSWPPPPQIQRANIAELMSGWYLRGDVGYRFNRIGTPDSANPITSPQFDNAAVLGGGAGYKYQWFRADLTVDYGTAAKFRGTTAQATRQPQYSAKIDTATALANVYIDFGTWNGFTPYAGVGVGMSLLRSADYVNTRLPASELVSTAQRWNFSWAGMGGVSYQFTPNWAIDAGYRYIRLGNAIGGTESTNQVTTFKSLSAHEIRVGFRYLLD